MLLAQAYERSGLIVEAVNVYSSLVKQYASVRRGLVGNPRLQHRYALVHTNLCRLLVVMHKTQDAWCVSNCWAR